MEASIVSAVPIVTVLLWGATTKFCRQGSL